MASSLSGICFLLQKLTLKPSQNPPLLAPSHIPKSNISFQQYKPPTRFSVQAVVRKVQPSVSNSTNNVVPAKSLLTLSSKSAISLEKDPRELWTSYVDCLYQHKELGLYLDMSRVGFTDEFIQEMEPRLQKGFKAMEELEKGAIANPDEGRMVGHYWLRQNHAALCLDLQVLLNRQEISGDEIELSQIAILLIPL